MALLEHQWPKIFTGHWATAGIGVSIRVGGVRDGWRVLGKGVGCCSLAGGWSMGCEAPLGKHLLLLEAPYGAAGGETGAKMSRGSVNQSPWA